MKRCPNNDSMPSIVDGDRFCYKCGAELADVRACECGRTLTPADVFCPRCGKKVEG